jgi:hypothetical protein
MAGLRELSYSSNILIIGKTVVFDKFSIRNYEKNSVKPNEAQIDYLDNNQSWPQVGISIE